MTGSDHDTERVILPIPAPPRRWPHLVVVQGPDAGHIFRLVQPQTVIGRAAEADVCLQAGTISRRHAMITVLGDRLLIEDLGSRNGTFIGVDQIKQPRELVEGCLIAIGDRTLLNLMYTFAIDDALRQVIYDSASRDPVTRVSNTCHFLDRLRSDYAFARRHRAPLTMIFLRVDSPAGEPQTASGPVPGDDVMRTVAALIRQTLRAEDSLARSGDDEFVVLLRGDLDQAGSVAERARLLARRPPEPGETARLGVTLAAVLVPVDWSIVVAPETLLVAARALAADVFREGIDHVVRLHELGVPSSEL